MLTNEVRVNGRLIGHLYVLNLQVTSEGKTYYKVEYYQVGSGKTIQTEVMHNQDDGAEKLIQLCMEKIIESKQLKRYPA